MKKIKIIGWITVGFLLLLQTGCEGTASSVTQTTEEPLAEIKDITTADTTEPQAQASTQQDTEIKVIELEEEDNLDTWLGTYTFDEVYDDPFMFMDYDVNVYKENGRYYADVDISGQFTSVHVKTNVYGNSEWISFALREYYPDEVQVGVFGEDSVLFSMRKYENSIYTYWGIQTSLGIQNNQSGGIYFKQTEVSDTEITENITEEDNLKAWVGTYSFTEETETDGVTRKTKYVLDIYNEDGQYYGDMVISGVDKDMKVKLKIYGDEQWISLVLSEVESDSTEKLENMKEMVLFSLGEQDGQVYTFWGGLDMTMLLDADSFSYYDNNCYFEKQ